METPKTSMSHQNEQSSLRGMHQTRTQTMDISGWVNDRCVKWASNEVEDMQAEKAYLKAKWSRQRVDFGLTLRS